MNDSRRLDSDVADDTATSKAPSNAPGALSATSAPPDSPPGYELIDEIGHGGMGVVYRARDIALDRDVAVKLLSDSYPADSPAAERFLSEARITGQLQHPGIPAVHQVGTLVDGRPFLAMKLIKGSTLEAILKQRSDPLVDRGRLLAIFEAICQAVGYAHAHRVIHRDLKPPNVMVGAFGEVQVMDWGLAKVLGEETPASAEARAAEETRAWTQVSPTPETGSHTQTGSLVGTPAFIPPEQALGEIDKVNERSDVFGLGALLAVILTGQPPYVGETFESVRVQAARGKLEDCFARLDASGAEAELVALCKKCLAFEPEDRPADAGSVAAAVAGLRAAADERARRAELDKVRVEGEKAAAEARAIGERRARRLFVALAALVFLTAGVGAAGWRWIELQRLGRAREATAKVTIAAQEATRLRGQAQGAAVGDLAPWNLAVVAAEKTRDLLAEGVEPGIKEQVENLVTEVVAGRERAQAAADAAERDRRLLAHLVDIRSAKVDDASGIGTDVAYANAFRDAGIDPDRLTQEECAAGIKSRPPTTAEAISAALDDWADVRRDLRSDASGAKRLTAAARVADPDPWRNKLRDALEIADKPTRRGALTALATSIKDQPLPPVSFDLLGEALRRADARAEGESILRKGRRLYPNDLWLNYDLAGVLGELSRREEAIRYYTAARVVNPASAHELAHALENKGESDEAISVFRELVRLRPNNGRHLACFGNLLQNRGRKEEARAVLTLAVAALRDRVAARPDDGPATMNLGNALKSLGRLDEAIEMYRKAIQIKPDYVIARENLGISLYLQRKYDEALAIYRDALRLDPKTISAHQGLAEVLEAKGRVDEAIDICRRGIRVAPDDGWLHMKLGFLLPKKGRLEEALFEAKEAVRLAPDDSGYVHGLAVALRELGRFDEAQAAYRKSLDLNRNNPYPLNALAWHLLTEPDRRQRRPEEALQLSRRAVQEGSDVATNFNTLGLAEYRSGHWDAAITTLKKSIEMSKGTDPTDFFFLAMVYWRRGDKAEAERFFQKGIEGAKQDAPNQWEWRMIWAEAAELLGKPGPVPVLYEVKAEPDRAMATLRRMAAAGFLQPEVLKTSPDLAPLRDRPEFQLLLQELTKPPQPTGKK
jgi:serine/threonine-protein kinase